MKIEQLQYLVEIAKTGYISEAAKNMHISQAAISKALANFENEYDVKLFNRNKNGTVLTDEGKEIIAIAADLLVRFHELEKKIKNKHLNEQKSVKISSTADLIASVLPEVLIAFKEKYPNHDIVIMQKDADEVLEDVKKEKADLGVASLHEDIISDETLSFETILE
ncbi:LysR family transcriptional regulator, partial [Bacillus sp. JJ722]|uniref:LysR family transcriptional regulator n=1 Tax=Bacillus sp. JJ722 TaxID=3122973 RepID=UPI00300034BB